MPLTDTAVRNAKPQATPYKRADEKGLYLLVQPSAAKYWRLKYRFAGLEKKLSFGTYPDVSLRDARDKRDEARKLLSSGIDPGAAHKLKKAMGKTAAADTLEALAREWLLKQTYARNTHEKALWMFETFIFPRLGSRPIAEITAAELLSVLRLLEQRGKLDTLQRVRQYCGCVFRYAIACGKADRDVSADLKGALKTPKTKHRAAIIDPQAVGGLMRAIDSYSGTFVVASALKLAPLVFVRPGELRHAEWSEIDLDGAEWRIPAGKMKMRIAHIVPLSVQAIAILRELHPLTGSGLYVFPGVRSSACPMSEAAVLAALRRMGYTGEEMSGHGFRAMARTLLAEKGWNTDAIERQLAHKASGPLGAAYDRAQFLPERCKMMQDWANYLDALRENRKVVAGKFGKAA